ncbi:MAG: substrate-binding domain-containing protein [Bacteroidales bacterium]|nr:substrate-binding domain-containing protein [Bacteroidales bacterium]
MKLRQISCLAILSTLMVFGTSCHRKDRKPELTTPTTGEVLLYADESFSPVIDPLLQVFNGIYSYATVSCKYLPETDILNAMLKFETPMIFATRPLTTQEKEFFASRQYSPKENLVAMDAIALIVHPSMSDSLISVGQIRDILTGKIRTWSQLGYKSEHDKIQVVFDNEGSGTVRFMIDSICKGEPFGPGLSALNGNQQVIDFIARSPGSMGVIGVSWICDSRDPVSLGYLKTIKVLKVSRTTPALPENSFLPYQAFIGNMSYPLFRGLFQINAEPRNGLASGFASFVCSSRGQRIILKTGIMPVYPIIRNVKITD